MISATMQAIIYGFLIGDTMGDVTHELSLVQIIKRYGQAGLQDLPASVGTVDYPPEKALQILKGDKLPEALQEVVLAGYRARDGFSSERVSWLAVATWVQLVKDTVPPEQYLAQLWVVCGGKEAAFDMTIRKIGHVLGWGSEIHAMRHLGTGNTDNELMTLALYCVLRYPDDFTMAMRRAVNTDGNSQAIAAIVGAVMGLKLGLDGIPTAWREPFASSMVGLAE